MARSLLGTEQEVPATLDGVESRGKDSLRRWWGPMDH